MKKTDLEEFIRDLEIRQNKLQEDFQRLRDEEKEAQGAIGEIQLIIWKLQEKLK